MLGRQVQHAHVLSIRTPRRLLYQGVVAAPIRQTQVQVLAINVARKRSRLSYQPVDDMPIVDPVLRLATQSFHPLHPLAGIPHLDLLHANARLDPFPTQPRRHRVCVLLHLDRRALAHPHTLTFACLQPTLGQWSQTHLLLGKPARPARVSPGHQCAQKLLVLLATAKVPAAAQHQLLLQRLLETPMPLLAISVLVAAVGVRGLGRHAVVSHQTLIPRRILLQVPIVVNGKGHPVRPVTLGHSAQFPQGVLHPGAEAGEALGKAHAHVLPVRVGQHEVVQQVRQGLPLNAYVQPLHVCEVRRPKPPCFMHLAEVNLLGWSVLALPLPHPPFHRSPLPLPVLAGVFPLQPVHQRLGLQRRLSLQQFLQARPDINQWIGPSPPGVGAAALTGQSPLVAILPCGLAVHACFHRRVLQRCPPVQVAAKFLDLFVGHLAASSHVTTPFVRKLPP